MRIARWDPFRELEELRKDFDRFFSRAPLSLWGEELATTTGVAFLPVDIKEESDAIVIKADLPGVKKEDIDVRVDGNLLTIKAEKKFEEKEEEKDRYHRIERYYGVFQRSFTLPDRVDPEKMKARYEDGVLILTLPKRPEAKPKTIRVE
jgi:HSP20 family protein